MAGHIAFSCPLESQLGEGKVVVLKHEDTCGVETQLHAFLGRALCGRELSHSRPSRGGLHDPVDSTSEPTVWSLH